MERQTLESWLSSGRGCRRLAEKKGGKYRLLSNEMEGKNFYNFINSLRIKEFIKIASLPENKKYTMISLAYDCGFSTKSTFNKHFKLQTGKTPTQFFNS